VIFCKNVRGGIKLSALEVRRGSSLAALFSGVKDQHRFSRSSRSIIQSSGLSRIEAAIPAPINRQI
jgi:hypothetical protein